MVVKHCPCCNNEETSFYLRYDKFPELIFPVDHTHVDLVDQYVMELYICNLCFHIFQGTVDAEKNANIYKKLYSFYPFSSSETFNQIYRTPFYEMADKVLEIQKEEKLDLLEIGSSNYQEVEYFIDKGYQCTAIDPSAKTGNIKDLYVIGDFYEKVVFEKKFDIVVMRFNLEHIIDLNLLIKKIINDVKIGGTIFVQVPNIKGYIEQGNFCFAAHEHIHYFSEMSLKALFKRYGFEEHEKTVTSSSLIFAFTYHGNDLGNFYDHYRSQGVLAKQTLEALIKEYKNICFYGCGLQLAWVLYVCGNLIEDKSITIVDDNQFIHGKYMPRTNFIVQSPDEIPSEAELIILTVNPVYYPIVKEKIKVLMQGRDVKVIGIENNNWVHQGN